MTTQNSTKSAAAGALYSFLLRILSFTLSQLTIRFVDPATLGKASIRLELICSTTVLFLGREGFRLALLRVADDGGADYDDHKKHKCARARLVNNVSWLSVPISLFLTSIALTFHLNTYQVQGGGSGNENVDLDEIADYKMAGILYCLATAIEIFSEPCMIVCMRQIDIKTRAKAEAFASVGKALGCVLLLSFDQREYHTASFGFAQCIYAIILSTVLYIEKWHCLEWPSIIRGDQSWGLWTMIRTNFDQSSIRLSALFSLQSIFKHMLTEGDRIVLTALVGAYDSGVYAMASSYGGMASRLLFQPLEENGRLLFSNKHAFIIKAKEEKKDITFLVDELFRTYCTLVKFVIYIGLIFAAFGYNYTSVLLRILAGARWGSNPEATTTLSAFCIYIALMALNGMTEAFVFGVAESGKEVGGLALAHGLVGVMFYITAPQLVRGNQFGFSGTVGLVAANGLCMVLRSIYSLHFARSYFQDCHSSIKEETADAKTSKRPKPSPEFLNNMMPRASILFSFLFSFCLTHQSRIAFVDVKDSSIISIDTAFHLCVGIGCFVFTACLIYTQEKDFGRSLRAMISKKSETKSKAD